MWLRRNDAKGEMDEKRAGLLRPERSELEKVEKFVRELGSCDRLDLVFCSVVVVIIVMIRLFSMLAARSVRMPVRALLTSREQEQDTEKDSGYPIVFRNLHFASPLSGAPEHAQVGPRSGTRRRRLLK